MRATHLIDRLVESYPDLSVCAPDIMLAFELLEGCLRSGGKLLICGNGGSAADAEHIVGELMKGFKAERRLPQALRQKLEDADPEGGRYLAEHLQGALPALSLVSQSSLISAIANDTAPNLVYAQQVYGYGKEGDVVLGISTSGDSDNVLNALRVGRALGLSTLGFTGASGGAMKALCDVTIRVPQDETLAVQERHLPIYHTLCDMLEQSFFPE